MARNFNGTSAKVGFALGALPTAPTAFTFAAIVRIQAVARWNNIVGIYTSGDVSVADMTIDNTNALSLEYGASIESTVTGIGTGWQFLAISKAAGITAPRGHRYIYSTNAWTHTNGVNAANPSGTGAKVWMGAYGGSGDFFSGDIAAAGIWDAALTDAQIENLPFTLQGWFSADPRGLWLLDQSATTQKIVDVAGGGANESALTGTTVASASVPVFNYTDGIWLPTIVIPGAGGGHTIPLGLISETDSLFSPAALKSKTLGQTLETDSMFALTRNKTRALGQVTETDSIFGVARLKKRTLSQLTELDSTFALGSSQLILLGLITESDTLFGLGRAKQRSLAQLLETDSTFGFGRAKQKTLAQIPETDSVFGLLKRKVKALGLASETDSPLALTRAKSRGLGLVTESDTAQPVARRKLKVLGLLSETDSALPLVAKAAAVARHARTVVLTRFGFYT